MVLPISVFLSPLLPSQPIETYHLHHGPAQCLHHDVMIFVTIVFIMIFVTVEVEEEGWCARPVV